MHWSGDDMTQRSHDIDHARALCTMHYALCTMHARPRVVASATLVTTPLYTNKDDSERNDNINDTLKIMMRIMRKTMMMFMP